MHGTADDLVPCEQGWETTETLRQKGVECGIAAPEGGKRLFNTFKSEDPEGYAFPFRQVGL